MDLVPGAPPASVRDPMAVTYQPALETAFVVESFETFLPDERGDDRGLHVQSALLRKP